MAGMAENTKYRAFTHAKQQHYTVFCLHKNQK